MKFDIERSKAILERTPAVIKALLQGLPNEWTENNEGNGTWSPYDIVGHLIHGEKTDWIKRAEILIGDGEEKVFEPFDRFAQFEASKGKSLPELIAEFESLRKRNLAVLDSFKLTGTDLDSDGTHPELGTVSLRQLLATWAVHDLGHLAQISRVMAQQYKDEVGPWSVYLGVLHHQK